MTTLDKQPYTRAEHEHIALRIHSALYEMLNGTARREEWQDMADCINMLDALLTQKHFAVPGDPYRKLVQLATDGLVDAIDCQEHYYRMHARQAHAMKHVVLKYDECVGRLARGTLQRAGEHVIIKIAQAQMPGSDVRIVG